MSVNKAENSENMFYVEFDGVSSVNIMTRSGALGYEEFLINQAQNEDIEQMKQALDQQAQENPDGMTLDDAKKSFIEILERIKTDFRRK